jgi:hypothetical protein
VDVPSCCPRCGEPFCWVVGFSIDREVAWAAPHGPAFLFRCAACEDALGIAFTWRLERGSDPRPLRLVGGGTSLPAKPCILLVDQCPHGCGAKLGLQLEPDDPGLAGTVWICSDLSERSVWVGWNG